jgi:hypothetical protein
VTLERLLAIEDIKQLKYRYIRAMDWHDWALMATCFADDATAAFASGLYSMEGRGEILEFFRTTITDGLVSSHVVTQPEITFLSDDQATAIWRLQDVVHLAVANPAIKSTEVAGGEELRGAAYYYDEYVRLEEGWKIRYSAYERIFRQVTSASGTTLTVNPTLGRRDWP